MRERGLILSWYVCPSGLMVKRQVFKTRDEVQIPAYIQKNVYFNNYHLLKYKSNL